MRRLLLFSIGFALTFLFPLKISAQDVDLDLGSITPTVYLDPASTEPVVTGIDTACGDAYGTGTEKRCCTVDWNSLSDQDFITDESGKSLCVDILLAKVCLSDLFNSAKRSVMGLFNLQEMGSIAACKTGSAPEGISPEDPSCICSPDPDAVGIGLCNRYLFKSKDYDSCIDCFAQKGYWSAVGCVYLSNFNDFVEKNVFGLLVGLAGLFAFFCIIYSAFTFQISQGNPERVKKAQQLLTSCVMGLILIIFSVFILRLIGVNILKIPGFN